MNRIYLLLLLFAIYFLVDFYVFQVVRHLFSESHGTTRKVVQVLYWIISIGALAGVLLYNQLDPHVFKDLRLFITSFFFITLISKLFSAIILLGDDIRRGVVWLSQFFGDHDEEITKSDRSAFVGKLALVAGAVPLTAFTFGIISGAHDYRVRNRVIRSANLPRQFDGFRIVQISDIHTGSFFNKTAVMGGVDTINQQKADLVCFTGDLVNYESKEARDYLDIFKKIKTPLGVYSTMGNHDYGDYKSWTSIDAKQKDVKNLHEMHRYMDWNILLNEHKILTVDGEQIALLGVENWGAGRFSKYGDLPQTYRGTEESPFKVLMSHDPSHWDAQIRPQFSDIDLTLAGHTHGMQFGIEIGSFRWSPAQYVYKQWADLYQQGHQYLYVNRGFGFIGYPGRVGILPEITVLELKRG
ncbi:MAG: metallophosphoesterase [Cyclobacteriaceae bacterium]|nr:metallophosphoesterase [Cyclobacteriaceae bacterium HetDA_MAG_MS6]